MKQVAVCSLIFMVFSCHGARLNRTWISSSTTSNSTATKEQAVDVMKVGTNRLFGHDVAKKPVLSEVGGIKSDSRNSRAPDRQVHEATMFQERTRQRLGPSSSLAKGLTSRRAACSPQLYPVTLGTGHCSRRVYTKMCYGQCASYTFPRRSNFQNAREAMGSVDTSCTCCSAVQMSTRRHKVRCRGSETTETFHVPYAESCTCRPCRS